MEIAGILPPERVRERRQQRHIIHHNGEISGNGGDKAGCQNHEDEQAASHHHVDLRQAFDAGIHAKHHRSQRNGRDADDQQDRNGGARRDPEDFMQAGSNLASAKAKRGCQAKQRGKDGGGVNGMPPGAPDTFAKNRHKGPDRSVSG